MQINNINEISVYVYLIIIILIIVIIFGIFLAFFWKKTKKIDPSTLLKFKKYIALTGKGNKSFKEQIMDYDKIYHNILKEIGYSGSFGEILKQNPIIITNIQKIWELHKLRNKIAHDFDNVGQQYLQKKSLEYKKEVNKLLKNVS